jgi:hypothetical protein
MRVRLADTVARNKYKKTGKKRGRKKVIEKGIDLSMMETAIRTSNGMVTKAARVLGVPIPTLQHYIRKHTTLRDALFETRSELVDDAEDSLRMLVKDKNLTAVIFTLKCLGQDRGYIDSVQKDGSKTAPIIINLVPASADVKLPRAEVITKGKRRVIEAEARKTAKILSLPRHDEDENEEARTIEIENNT